VGNWLTLLHAKIGVKMMSLCACVHVICVSTEHSLKHSSFFHKLQQ